MFWLIDQSIVTRHFLHKCVLLRFYYRFKGDLCPFALQVRKAVAELGGVRAVNWWAGKTRKYSGRHRHDAFTI